MCLEFPRGVIRHFNEEGWIPSLKRSLKEVVSPVHRYEEYLFYTLSLNEPLIEVPALGNPILNIATLDDLSRLSRVMYGSVKDARNWLLNGQVCLYLTIAGKIASYGWVALSITPLDPLGDLWARLPQREAFAHTMRTLPAFRGMGLYPFMLVKMGEYLRQRGFVKLWAFSSPRNAASKKGLGTAGLRKVGAVAYRRLFWKEEFVLQGEVQWVKEGRSGKLGKSEYTGATFVDGASGCS